MRKRLSMGAFTYGTSHLPGRLHGREGVAQCLFAMATTGIVSHTYSSRSYAGPGPGGVNGDTLSFWLLSVFCLADSITVFALPSTRTSGFV